MQQTPRRSPASCVWTDRTAGFTAPSPIAGRRQPSVTVTVTVTNLLLVRFSSGKVDNLFADGTVITTHHGKPTLMLRPANGRLSIMSSATARVFSLLAEETTEGALFRRIPNL